MTNQGSCSPKAWKKDQTKKLSKDTATSIYAKIITILFGMVRMTDIPAIKSSRNVIIFSFIPTGSQKKHFRIITTTMSALIAERIMIERNKAKIRNKITKSV